jgi:hypothetical protein
MPVTLTDQQAAQIRQLIEEGNQAKVALKGAQELWNDPALGDQAKALWKKKWPDATIEGYDAKQEVKAVVDGFKEEREKEKREAAERAETERMLAQRKMVQERRGYTDDAMQRMEKLMEEKKVYDYEAGDLLFAAKNPTPSDGSAAYDKHFWNHEKQPGYKEIAADPERWGFNELARAVERDAQQRKQF